MALLPNSWCGNFVERHSFRIVSGKSPETKRKLCLSKNTTHQEITSVKLRRFIKCLAHPLVNCNLETSKKKAVLPTWSQTHIVEKGK